MQKALIIASVFSIALSACQSADPTYVSEAQYSGYNCRQLSMEMQRIGSKIEQRQQTAQANQVMNTAVAVFAVSQGYAVAGGGDEELARLQNAYDVVERLRIKKDCQ